MTRFLSLIIAALIVNGAGVQATLHSDGSGATETPVCCIDVNGATPSGAPDGRSSAGTGETRQALRGAPHGSDRTGPPTGSDDPAGSSLAGGAPLARRISGTATWYCGGGSPCTRGYRPGQLVAAIDTDLGFHKGDRVRVSAFGRSVVVRIVDVCGCAGDRLIDLSREAFSRLADPDYGVIPVMLELADGPIPLAPQTDSEAP